MKKNGYHYYREGVQFLEKGELVLALKSLQQSLELESHFKTYSKLAEVSKLLGKVDEAFNYSEKAYNLNKDNDQIAFNYVKLLIGQKQFTQAETILTKLLHRNTSYKPAANLLEKLKFEKDSNSKFQ